MERRFLFGIVLLTLLLALAAGTALGMKAIHAPAEDLLTEASRLALSGEWEQAVALAREAYAHWLKYRDITAVFADHTPMDEAEQLFREMGVYAQAKEIPHFAACCQQLSAMLRAMYETHSLSLKNIL